MQRLAGALVASLLIVPLTVATAGTAGGLQPNADAAVPGAPETQEAVADPLPDPGGDADLVLAAIGVDDWHRSGYVGDGVRVAVIDTGFGRWADAEAAGEVPAVPAERRVDLCDRGFEARPYGTANSAVLHRVAPRAELVLVCIDDAADLSRAVDLLPGLGVDIVNMSLGFYNTAPGDGRGGPGSPDDSARRALDAGIAWVNSAGNEADVHYAGAFTDPAGDGFHEWIPGRTLGAFTAPPGGDVQLYLRWDQWEPGALSDRFELCLQLRGNGPLTCPAVVDQRDTPTTGLALTNPREEPVTFEVALRRTEGSGSPHLDFFLSGASSWEHPVPAASLVDPAAVEGVVAVGAFCVGTGEIQPSSSRGPTVDGRPGIILAAPAAVSGDLVDAVEHCAAGSGGTATAAAHTAGALALLRQHDRTASAASLVAELVARTERAGDPGAAGVDPVYGHGRLFLGPPPPFRPGAAQPPDTAHRLRLVTSPGPDRADAVPFGGGVVGGDLFVHIDPVHPPGGVREVRFYVDGILVQVEREAGYDLGGGMWDRGYPFDTTRLADGPHRLDAVVTRLDGTEIGLTAGFTVDNTDRPPRIPIGTLSARPPGEATGGVPLDGTRLSGDEQLVLELGPEAGEFTHVMVYVDAVLVGWTDRRSFVAPAGVLEPFGAGQHMAQVIVFRIDGSTPTLNSSFTVAG